MNQIVFLNYLRATSPKPVIYKRYLRLQEKLRQRRKELLIFCSHPSVITAGAQSRSQNLLVSLKELEKQNVAVIPTKRGGDYTAHELGQCVIYPHIDLRKRNMKIHFLIQGMLEITSELLQEIWGIKVFLDSQSPGLYRISDSAKIASIGLMFKSFFTSFGIALNVSNSLETFRFIHPCGYEGLRICSVENSGGNSEFLPLFIHLWKDRFQQYITLN